MQENILEIKGIEKSFGNLKVLNSVSFNAKKGEFITVLGPSGCGKTTLIKIIGGLLQQDSGNVILKDKNIDELPPEKREVNTVFQNFALFPHLNVFDNVAYGLKIKKYSKRQIKEEVGTILGVVGLSGFEKRKIDTLSGGQKQRVATARALCLKPEILLLDEPLGALDYNLKSSMMQELKSMQQKLGTTFIYITHDREEAFYLADKIIIMNNGNIEQIGTPVEIYNKPNNLFVAKFMGQPNILNLPNGDFGILKPESVKITENGQEATVVSSVFAGGVVKTRLKLNDGSELLSYAFENHAYNKGEKVNVSYTPQDIHIIKGE